mmetsp:Transcript_35140/g.85098  ORF Transcript_35140/g.85098 Transcript_35140/m.85098 type:complete len:743 (-) Transcript_35140:1249-3477(-)|eukprot:CAMPEP_0113654088 /NCGR_PEP_ID=MMETSP0017_2-20120614/28964_1 /TAXON_ID=2856 /ORGANISM="Cylindrotheca closterium" /LENGTH=742 /DNA_ID=CAMNT_0000567201 /DNA_START=443 /DNA_END=2671 /DNA_ORIENTATION=+ /assembly_acc=CAM_ASM_000147
MTASHNIRSSDSSARLNAKDEEQLGCLEAARPAKEEMVINTPLGCLRGKFYIKAAVQSAVFLVVLSCYGVANFAFSAEGGAMQEDDLGVSRFLQETTPPSSPPTVDAECAGIRANQADPVWMAVFYTIGVMYMFLALAIACDEFFVPALEEMSSPRRMNLSMDVAGATLMAAGGSAPELFTALFGTFQESAIGFGTIVGSAVFNVLFVIAMCSLLANEVLQLTWWPLFRDSFYYVCGLGALAAFVGFVGPDEVELWEACVLFSLYLGYIILMWQNANLYKAITGKTLDYADEEEMPPPPQEDKDTNGAAEESANNDEEGGDQNGMKRQGSKSASLSSNISNGGLHHGHHPAHFRWQGTFRAGILKLLKDPDSWMDTAGVGIVAKIAGDADYVFSQVDIDGNGHVDREELKQLFNLLECYITPRELEEVFNQLDEDKDGTISQTEFTEWYCRSEERILSQVHHVFDQIDVDKSGSIDRGEVKTLLTKLDPHTTDDDVVEALNTMYKGGSREEITFEEFADWYKQCAIFEKQKALVEEDMQGVWENLKPPRNGSCRDWTWYIVVLPLVAVMTFTVPDVRRPGMGKWCYLSFLLSIGWIGGFSFFMVDWTEIVGNTIGIPPVIMGLTVLAAGTSVPDLLSSVIVARRGSGDMAVSSSIGSNIFDILVGLPFPWILYTAIREKPVSIDSSGLVRSLLILVGMIVLVIGAVHCQGWRLTKTLGGIMFLFYLGFLTQAIVLELPFKVC